MNKKLHTLFMFLSVALFNASDVQADEQGKLEISTHLQGGFAKLRAGQFMGSMSGMGQVGLTGQILYAFDGGLLLGGDMAATYMGRSNFHLFGADVRAVAGWDFGFVRPMMKVGLFLPFHAKVLGVSNHSVKDNLSLSTALVVEFPLTENIVLGAGFEYRRFLKKANPAAAVATQVQRVSHVLRDSKNLFSGIVSVGWKF